jgi:hypothetical protein
MASCLLSSHSNPANSSSSQLKVHSSKGILQSKQKIEIAACFHPKEAKCIIGKSQIKCDGQIKIIKLSGIGKYPFVGINYEKLDFGELPIGKSATKELILFNDSLVSASFEIKEEDTIVNNFKVSPLTGTIPSKSSFRLLVTYTPTIVSFYSSNQFKAIIKGGNELLFTCLGMTTGCDGELSAKSINFGEVTVGGKTNRVLFIYNKTTNPLAFQIYCEKKSVFSFVEKQGMINPNSDYRGLVYFYPERAMNYYQRVYIVLKNHQILYVDLLGTGYDLLNRPFPLIQRHIDKFRQKVIMGRHTSINDMGFLKSGKNFNKSPEVNKSIRTDTKSPEEEFEFHEESIFIISSN